MLSDPLKWFIYYAFLLLSDFYLICHSLYYFFFYFFISLFFFFFFFFFSNGDYNYFGTFYLSQMQYAWWISIGMLSFNYVHIANPMQAQQFVLSAVSS
jgi:hypothetical protein